MLPKLLLRVWFDASMGAPLPVGEGVGEGRAVRRKKLMDGGWFGGQSMNGGGGGNA